MRNNSFLVFVVTLAISISISATKPADAGAEASAEEAKAQANYDAAEKAAGEAEAAVGPLLDTMKKADVAYANARKAANAARQKADTAKNLAGKPGAQSLKRAEDAVPAADKALADATKAKPPLDKAMAEAKVAAAPLQETFKAADKVAKEAEAAARAAATAANRLDTEAKRATAQAKAKRKAADNAKAALEKAQQKEQKLQTQVNEAPQALAEAEALKKAADEDLAAVTKQVAAATTAHQAAEKAALAAAANAKPVTEAEKQQAAADAAAKRKAADAAKAALTQAQQKQQQAQAQATAAAQKLAGAPAQKKAADNALAAAKKQVAAATGAHQAAEKAAQAAEDASKAIAADAAKTPEEKKKAADEATAKRAAANTAKTALTQAQQKEQQAQAQVNAAAKSLADAPAQKKAADEALAAVKKQVAAATTAHQAAEKAAQGAEATAKALAARAGRSPEQVQQAVADAAAKRKAADEAESALTKTQQTEKAAAAPAKAAAGKLAQATAMRKVAEAGLANAKKQVAAATTALAAAEKAAAEFENIAEAANQAAAQAAAKRKAAADAAAALAQAKKAVQEAQAKVKAAKEGAEKTAAEKALAAAKAKVAAATTAHQAAQEAAKELLQLDAAMKQTAAVAAAKRKVANEAKAVLAPKQKTLDQAVVKATRAAQALNRAQKRKKSADAALENLKKRIAAAKKSHVADEQAAQKAEAAAVPLQKEAKTTRAAWRAAVDAANNKRSLAQQAKAAWYKLVAARQVADIMESPERAEPVNGLDGVIFTKLKSLGIEPALCSDAVFIRRAFLDLTGKLPTAEEARAFIQDTDQNKRVALIDSLLERPAHFNYWAMRWSDIFRVKAEFPVKVWPNAAQAYHRYLWESVAQNKPYDQFVRELLTSSGSNFRVGAVNFYRAIQDKTPEGIAASVALALMGSRVHYWPEDRRAGMAVFFTQVGYKPTSEWKEEIVFWDPLKSTAVPGSIAPGIPDVAKSVTATNKIPLALAQPMNENAPLAAVFPDGTKTTIPPDRDPREVFAEWLIRPENPWFAKAIVNRTWAWAMGRGIVHEADDIRDDNPPSNPELLAYLEKELVSSGYDLKHLKRLIYTSTAYQFSPIAKSDNPEAAANFASYRMRRLEAEVLIDALNEITGGTDLYTSAVPEPFTYIPNSMSAVELADGSVTSSFLQLFGRSARSTGMETERVNELASPQWLHMLNSATLNNKLVSGPKLRAMISAGGTPKEIAERIYLTILSRFPTDADVEAAEEHAKTGVAKGNDVWIDVAWSLVNSPEFLLRH